MLPTNWRERQFTITWQEGSRIDRGIVLLLGGGLALGQLMFTTGLAEHLWRGLLRVSGAAELWTLTAVAIAIGMILTELTSNTASTSMLLPVVLAMCAAGGIHPVPPALGAMLGASSSYALPISAPHIAIMYGTGLIPITAMIRFGLLVKACAFIIIWMGLRLLCPLLGFA